MALVGDDMATAGRPSNWEDARRTSYAGNCFCTFEDLACKDYNIIERLCGLFF